MHTDVLDNGDTHPVYSFMTEYGFIDPKISLYDICEMGWKNRLDSNHPIHAIARRNFNVFRKMLSLQLEIFYRNKMMCCIGRLEENTTASLFTPGIPLSSIEATTVIYMGAGRSEGSITDPKNAFTLAKRVDHKMIHQMVLLTPNKKRRRNMLFSSEKHFSEKIICTSGGIQELEADQYRFTRQMKNRKPLYTSFTASSLLASIIYVIRDVIVHPLEFLYNMFLTAHASDVLYSLFDRVSDRSIETEEMFMLAHAFFRYCVNVFDPDEVYPDRLRRFQTFAKPAMEATLTASFILLCQDNRRYRELHDAIRIHECFWVENLTQWIEMEVSGGLVFFSDLLLRDRLGREKYLSSMINNSIWMPDSCYFMLKLNVLDVGHILKMIRPTSLMNSISSRPLDVNVSEGMAIPDYSSDRYQESSLKSMLEIIDYCKQCSLFVRTNYPNVCMDENYLYKIDVS
ncbi:MAG: hypothetical protein JSS82_12575 [Bacteroidetes bacterium]|nr:hypothetical protein [Bacteroidota bacterium]